MTAQYTPGPWKLDGGLELVGYSNSEFGQHMLYCAEIRKPNFAGSICTIQSADHCDDAITKDAAEANARLIAAAPDLLESLKELLSEVDDGIATSPLTRIKAHDAITKATGQTKE